MSNPDPRDQTSYSTPAVLMEKRWVSFGDVWSESNGLIQPTPVYGAANVDTLVATMTRELDDFKRSEKIWRDTMTRRTEVLNTLKEQHAELRSELAAAQQESRELRSELSLMRLGC